MEVILVFLITAGQVLGGFSIMATFFYGVYLIAVEMESKYPEKTHWKSVWLGFAIILLDITVVITLMRIFTGA